jgi:hypothetical protein
VDPREVGPISRILNVPIQPSTNGINPISTLATLPMNKWQNELHCRDQCGTRGSWQANQRHVVNGAHHKWAPGFHSDVQKVQRMTASGQISNDVVVTSGCPASSRDQINRSSLQLLQNSENLMRFIATGATPVDPGARSSQKMGEHE